MLASFLLLESEKAAGFLSAAALQPRERFLAVGVRKRLVVDWLKPIGLVVRHVRLD